MGIVCDQVEKSPISKLSLKINESTVGWSLMLYWIRQASSTLPSSRFAPALAVPYL